MTDYKALCKKLTDAYEHELNKRGMGCEPINNARAALAQPEQPEPEGATDEESVRTLCAELADAYLSALEHINDGEWLGYKPSDDPLLTRARTALAQPETPSRLHYCSTHGQQPENAWGCPECVREMRQQLAQPEPEGVTEEAWQWYSYCPEDGIELYLNKESAQKAAQEIMGSYAKAAHSDGWHEDMESVSWGMLLPVEQAQVVERTEAEPDSEFDEWIRYGLVPSHYARPAIEPVPVSERLPGAGDCDAEGRCWWFNVASVPEWQLAGGGPYGEAWLPHHALPVPTPKGAKPEPMRQHS